MPPKVWNEDLVAALKARHQQAWQQKSQSQYKWNEGAKTIEAIRKDIRLTSTGKIFNLPNKGLAKTVYEECVKIIQEEAPMYPPGFTPLSQQEIDQMEQNDAHPYIDKMKRRGGAYAIMMAFYVSGRDTMTKDQICTLAQPHCDEQMEANFHQGRMYGAWKSKDTLIRHDFLTEHKQGVQYTNQGFRSNGKNLYQMSPPGKKAMQQMIQKWPDIAAVATNHHHPPHENGPLTPGAEPRPIRLSSAGSQRFNTAIFKVHKNSPDDEQKLRDWLSTAAVGAQKVFKVGKERRKYLHRLCEFTIPAECPGLVLDTYSEGTGSSRHLYVTIRYKPLSQNTGSISTIATTPVASATNRNPIITPEPISSKKRLLTGGQQLGGGDGSKPKSIPARQAAAEAALARLNTSQTTTKRKRPRLVSSNPSLATVTVDLTNILEEELARKPAPSSSSPSGRASFPCAAVIDLDSDSEDDRKPAAKQMPPNRDFDGFDYQPGDRCLLLLEDNTELDGSYSIIRVHIDGHVTIRRLSGDEEKISVSRIRPFVQGDNEDKKAGNRVIDLCDDDIEKVGSYNVATSQRLSSHRHFKFLIDDRERSRNHKPRELRIELSKELRQGSFQNVWPATMPHAEVEERKLPHGDFAFQLSSETSEINDTESTDILSLVVERKQVADLVQRSTKGDHWKQLQRMRDHYQHAIMLIENETKFAGRFDAYGSQGFEDNPKPCRHTIENEQDLFRFVGRAILSSSKIKFIQTRDPRGTFRSIGALGLMASISSQVDRTKISRNLPTAASKQQKLQDHLMSGGIYWKLAKEIAKEVGCIHALENMYAKCSSLKAKKYLVQVILENSQDRESCPGRLDMWSEAIYRVFSSSPETRREKRNSYQDLLRNFASCCDPATLLCCIYTESSVDEAVDMAMGSTQIPPVSKRRVQIKLSKSLASYFETPKQESFYTISEYDDNPRSIPTVEMSTHAGTLNSSHLIFYVIDGNTVLEIAVSAIDQIQHSTGYIAAAKSLAISLKRLCPNINSSGPKNDTDRHLILIQGLTAAFDVAAKSSSYRDCTKVVVEMAIASLMIEHNLLVLQVVRKQMQELKMMLQQFALSCFHYQLLMHEDTSE